MFEKLTSVVVVEAIEPVLPTWRALGWSVTAEVPHGDRLGFVILTSAAGELMLQTRASVKDDLGIDPPAVLLYGNVASLDAFAAAVGDDVEVLIAHRTTFYGAQERWVRDASGTVICAATH